MKDEKARDCDGETEGRGDGETLRPGDEVTKEATRPTTTELTPDVTVHSSSPVSPSPRQFFFLA